MRLQAVVLSITRVSSATCVWSITRVPSATCASISNILFCFLFLMFVQVLRRMLHARAQHLELSKGSTGQGKCKFILYLFFKMRCCSNCCSPLPSCAAYPPRTRTLPYQASTYRMSQGGEMNCAIPPCASEGPCNCCPCCPAVDVHMIGWIEN